MRLKTCFIVVSAIPAATLTDLAKAQAPVAIVEEVVSTTAGVEFMDYLTPGRTIQLSPRDRLVIGYMKSCWRETITDGTVTVGAEQSEVSGGAVERVKVPCDAGKRGSTSKETTGSGAMVFRKKPDLLAPHQTIYGLSPILKIGKVGNVLIERIDKREKPIDLSISATQLSRGSLLDLSLRNVALTAGGLYRVKAGGDEVIFKVDPSAQGVGPTIIGRLVHLSPPG